MDSTSATPVAAGAEVEDLAVPPTEGEEQDADAAAQKADEDTTCEAGELASAEGAADDMEAPAGAVEDVTLASESMEVSEEGIERSTPPTEETAQASETMESSEEVNETSALATEETTQAATTEEADESSTLPAEERMQAASTEEAKESSTLPAEYAEQAAETRAMKEAVLAEALRTPEPEVVESSAVEAPQEQVCESEDKQAPSTPPAEVQDDVTSTAPSTQEAVPLNASHFHDMSYIKTRTADVDRVRQDDLSKVGSAAATAHSATVKKMEDGKFVVDCSYIDKRTADPNRLQARRSIAPNVVAPNTFEHVATTSAKKNEEGSGWSVDTNYIDARTKDVNRLAARRSISGLSASAVSTNQRSSMVGTDGVVAPVAADIIAPSATVKKIGDKKWSVDTSYIDQRTQDPNCLKPRRDENTSAATTKEADGSRRNVATPHLTHSASVKVNGGSGWKVDTSYIGHRTSDTSNLRQTEKEKEVVYADPTVTKYSYNELKVQALRASDVNPATKELYLSDDEFRSVFEMEPYEFQKLPRWKQLNMKKTKALF